MEYIKINVNNEDAGQSVVIQVAVELENMVRHGLQELDVPIDTFLVERIVSADRLPVFKFTCNQFPKERLDEFYWHAGDWYIRFHPLIKKHLN